MATGLFGFVLTTSWRHQLVLVPLTIAVFLLEVVPLELQRRMVNDIVKHRPYAAIIALAAGYLGAVTLQGATKLGLNIYRVWVGAHTKRDLRECILAATRRALPASTAPRAAGTAVAMTVAEVEPIGNFVGASLSEPLLQSGVLATVIAYIVHLDRWMGVAALLLFLPQLIFVPWMQHGMNRQSVTRTWLLRRVAQAIVGRSREEDGAADGVDQVFHIDMRIFELKFTMNFLMNLCSHLQIILALLLGGWRVLQGELEIGGVVAFLSGLSRLNDPWGDLVNYFRDYSNTRVKFDLLTAAFNTSSPSGSPGSLKGNGD